MSHPRIKVVATFDTLAHAQTVKNNLDLELAGKDIFRKDAISISQGSDNQNTLVFDVRLNRIAHRDSLKDAIVDRIRDNVVTKTWVTSARIEWHTCTHADQVVKSCKETDFSEITL